MVEAKPKVEVPLTKAHKKQLKASGVAPAESTIPVPSFAGSAGSGVTPAPDAPVIAGSGVTPAPAPPTEGKGSGRTPLLPPVHAAGRGVAPAPGSKARPCPYRDVREVRRDAATAASPLRRPAASMLHRPAAAAPEIEKGGGKGKGKVAAAISYSDRRVSQYSWPERPPIAIRGSAGEVENVAEEGAAATAASSSGARRAASPDRRVRRRQASVEHDWTSDQWRAWHRSAAEHWSYTENRWKKGHVGLVLGR